MEKTLKIAFRLKNAYMLNSVIYALKQIPFVKKVLPRTLYQSRGLKILAQIIAVIIEIGKIFLLKGAYLGFLVVLPLTLYKFNNPSDLYLHMLLLLTLIGLLINTGIIEPNKHRYYAIILMRMNAREYTLASLGYYIFKTILGFLPFLALFSGIGGVSPLYGVAMAFAIGGGKVAVVAWDLSQYEKKYPLETSTKAPKKVWSAVMVLLLLTYGGPAINLVLPGSASISLMMLMIILGILSIRKILNFKYYVELNKEVLRGEENPIEVKKNVLKEESEKNISSDFVTSNKKGLEYLNDLFVKRHKKIFWKATNKMTLAILVIVGVLSIVMIAFPETKGVINRGISYSFSVTAFLTYAFNRGEIFTRTLFMNCDHSMLTYPCFKNGSSILKLFKIRLKVLMALNFIPATVLGLGLCWILFMSGGTEKLVIYPIVFITILAMSFFFSIHYLTIYYLLQPYNAETELKSGMYGFITGITYFICYLQINLHISLIVYGAMWIVFAILYGVIASILVYKFAHRTFKIRI